MLHIVYLIISGGEKWFRGRHSSVSQPVNDLGSKFEQVPASTKNHPRFASSFVIYFWLSTVQIHNYCCCHLVATITMVQRFFCRKTVLQGWCKTPVTTAELKSTLQTSCYCLWELPISLAFQIHVCLLI